MSRSITMLFALVAYAIFFATFLYLIAFVGNIAVVPRTVDIGPDAAPATALVINVALIALFGLQHSVMARKGFKAWWTRVVPEPAERSVYVLMASAALIILFYFWRPIEGTVWSVTSPLGETVLWALFGLGPLSDRQPDGLGRGRFHRRLRLRQPQRQGRLRLRRELHGLGPRSPVIPAKAGTQRAFPLSRS